MEDHWRFRFFAIAKAPGITWNLTMWYSFVFPEKHGYLLIQLSNNAVTYITEKIALVEAVLISFYKKLSKPSIKEEADQRPWERLLGNNEICRIDYDLNDISQEENLIRNLSKMYSIYKNILYKSTEKFYFDYKNAIINLHEVSSSDEYDEILKEDYKHDVNVAIATSIWVDGNCKNFYLPLFYKRSENIS